MSAMTPAAIWPPAATTQAAHTVPGPPTKPRKVMRFAAAGLALGLVLAGCSGAKQDGPTQSAHTPTAAGGDKKTLTVVTHDSFALDKELLARFEKDNNVKIAQIAPGDAGALVNQLVLTKDAPLGDVVYGVDNTFASRAIAAGVFAPYFPKDANTQVAALSAAMEGNLTAVDFGDVCLNVDHQYFSDKKLAEPATFADLLKPEYANLTVVTNPATSSPGLAFLLGTIAKFGEDGWKKYWQDLKANGLKVDSSWSDAYNVDFSGSSGKGAYPVVLSYASSPPSQVPAGAKSAPTGALLDTCFRQVEYAGIIAGTKHADLAAKFVDFLVSDDVQATLPASMYMYPASDAVKLPEEWVKYAPLAKNPATLDPANIAAKRDQWIKEWTATVVG